MRYQSIYDAVYKIYHDEGGLSAFYVGIIQDTLKTIADSFLFFLSYDFLRRSRIDSRQGPSGHLSVLDELGVGFLAGALAKFVTTPLANIVTRKQSLSMVAWQTGKPKVEEASVRSIARQIKLEKGLRGFWSGYSASLVLTLNPTLTFFLFESFKRTFLSRRQQSKPSSRTIFFLAAISKAIASSITYPFSLAKARAQVSTNKPSQSLGDSSESQRVKPYKQNTGHETPRVPSNVFSAVFQIARNEGIGALYEGLGGEVLKGFFSHGITMIVKETVHKFIIQLYYAILKLLRSYPSPKALVEPARERIGLIAIKMEEQSTRALDNLKAGTQRISEKME